MALQLEPGAWDLSNCVLTGCTISCDLAHELDVRGSDLTGAKIGRGTTIAALRVSKDSVLTNTRFEEVTLRHADFTPVALQGTSFFHSTLQWVRFGAQLSDVRFGRASLSSVDLRDSQLLGCSLASIRATDCDFDNAKLHAIVGGAGTTLESAALRRCSCVDTDFAGCSLKNAVFQDTDLRRAANLTLDETVLLGSPMSAGAKDDWSTLRRSYTGANMVFNVIAMIIFFTPFIFQALYWSGFNQVQLGLLRGLTLAESELSKIPVDEVQRKAITVLKNSIDPQFERCLQPTNRSRNVDHPWCRPVWQILIGMHEGTFSVALSLVLIVYNIARLTLTWFVAPLRDEEVRTWHAPRHSAYAWMIPLHMVVKTLVWVAIAAAFVHLGPRLFSPVWLPGMSSMT